MLTEKVVIDQITVFEDGRIQVQRINKIFRDGVEIAREQPHQHVVAPGDNLSGEDQRVQKVARAVHTATVIAAYHKTIAENSPAA